VVKKSKKKNSVKSFNYKNYFHISLGAAIAFFIVAIILLVPFFSNGLVGEATRGVRDTTGTRLGSEISNSELLRYMEANNFLAQFKNCFCGDTCDDPVRDPLDEEETDERALCVDTDKGINSFTYGETFFIDNDGIKDKVNDECISMVSGVSGGTVQTSPTLTIGLLEYYCDDLRISSKKIECDCQDGVCIEDNNEDIGPLGVESNTEVIDAGDLPVVDNTATVDYPLDDEEQR